jgi:hypothetical protein
MDFTGKQDTDEQIVPMIVLIGGPDHTVDRTAAPSTLTVTGTDARAVAGAAIPADQLRTCSALNGLHRRQARRGRRRRRADPADRASARARRRRARPDPETFPARTGAATAGVGAKWHRRPTPSSPTGSTSRRSPTTGSSPTTARPGSGATKVTGKDRDVDNAKISSITGTGTSETTISDGALYPSHKASIGPSSGRRLRQVEPVHDQGRRRRHAEVSSARSQGDPLAHRGARRGRPDVRRRGDRGPAQPVTHSKPSQSTSSSAEPSSCVVISPTGQLAPIRVTAADRAGSHGDRVRRQHVQAIAAVRLEIEAGRAHELSPVRCSAAIRSIGRAHVAALVAEPDDVPLAGVVDDAVRVDRPALGVGARRRGVVDLDPLVLARGGDQLAQVAGDPASGSATIVLIARLSASPASRPSAAGACSPTTASPRRTVRCRSRAASAGRAAARRLGRRQPQRPGQPVRGSTNTRPSSTETSRSRHRSPSGGPTRDGKLEIGEQLVALRAQHLRQLVDRDALQGAWRRTALMYSSRRSFCDTSRIGAL